MSRFQFSLKWMFAAMLAVAMSCWLNRDAPVFAAVGIAGTILLLAGDLSLRVARTRRGIRFAVSVFAGAVSLGGGLWLLGASVLAALARRATFD